MSKLRIGVIGVLTVAVLVMSLNLIVSAVEEKKEEEEREALATQSAMEMYQSQVAELEKRLNELKEEQYVNKQAYEEKIEELELKLEEKNEVVVSTDKTPASDAKYTYTVSDNKITLTGYSGTDDVLKIPAEIDGLKVAEIGREAFKNATFKEVVIPSTVKKIDWFAFSECLSLEKITIPPEMEKIEYGAFNGAHSVVVHCVKNSYAHRYARSYGFETEFI